MFRTSVVFLALGVLCTVTWACVPCVAQPTHTAAISLPEPQTSIPLPPTVTPIPTHRLAPSATPPSATADADNEEVSVGDGSGATNINLRDTMNPHQWQHLLASIPAIVIPQKSNQVSTTTPLMVTPITPISTPVPAAHPAAPPVLSTTPPIRLYGDSSLGIAQHSSSPSPTSTACPVMPFTNALTMTGDSSRGATYTITFVPSNRNVTLVRMLARISSDPRGVDPFPHMTPMAKITQGYGYRAELPVKVKPGERLWLAFQYGLPSSSGTMLCTITTQSFQRAVLTHSATDAAEPQPAAPAAAPPAPAADTSSVEVNDATIQQAFDNDDDMEEMIDLDSWPQEEEEEEDEEASQQDAQPESYITQAETAPTTSQDQQAVPDTRTEQPMEAEFDAFSLFEMQLDTSISINTPNTNITHPDPSDSDSDSSIFSSALAAAAQAGQAAAMASASNDTIPYVPSNTSLCPSEALNFDLHDIYQVRHAHAPTHAVYRLDLITTEALSMKKAELHFSRDLINSDLMPTLQLSMTSPHSAHHVLSSIPLKKGDSLYVLFTLERDNGETCDSVLSQVEIE